MRMGVASGGGGVVVVMIWRGCHGGCIAYVLGVYVSVYQIKYIVAGPMSVLR